MWTEQLIRHARRITAIDAVSEMLTLNQSRVQSQKVHYLQAEIFHWNPIDKYNVVFFGFWLSPFPPERFSIFWDLVGSTLKPGGRVFFVDSRYDKTSTAKDHHLEGSDATIAKRQLNDGREFCIVKIFYEKSKLSKQLNELGWRLDIYETPNYFIYGSGYKGLKEQ